MHTITYWALLSILFTSFARILVYFDDIKDIAKFKELPSKYYQTFKQLTYLSAVFNIPVLILHLANAVTSQTLVKVLFLNFLTLSVMRILFHAVTVHEDADLSIKSHLKEYWHTFISLFKQK